MFEISSGALRGMYKRWVARQDFRSDSTSHATYAALHIARWVGAPAEEDTHYLR
jgi:hypothetical protein